MRVRIGLLLVVGLVMVAGISPATAASHILRCVDGDAASLVERNGDPVDRDGMICDGDGSRNGSCSFLSACPLCRFTVPPCAIACFIPPPFELARVPVGKSRAIRGFNEILLMRCDSAPRRAPHRSRPARSPH